MDRVITVPILIRTYECGPPALEQCPKCRFGQKVEHAVGESGEDGARKFLCVFEQDVMRVGICVFFKPHEEPEETPPLDLFHPWRHDIAI